MGATTSSTSTCRGPAPPGRTARAGGVQSLVLTHILSWNDPEVCRAQAAMHWPSAVGLAAADAVYEILASPVRADLTGNRAAARGSTPPTVADLLPVTP